MAKKILTLFLCLVILFTCAVTLLIGAEDTTAPEGNTTVGGETGSETVDNSAFYAALEAEIDSEAYPADKYPWAVFKKAKNEAESAYKFESAHAVFVFHEKGVNNSQTGYISALWSARKAASSSVDVLIFLRADYQWHTASNPAEFTGYFDSISEGSIYAFNEETGEYTSSFDAIPEGEENAGLYKSTHIADCSNDNIGQTVGNVTLELAGHTFDMKGSGEKTNLFRMDQKAYTTDPTNIIVRNGSVNNVEGTLFNTWANKGTTNYREINLTFENASVKISSEAKAIVWRSGNASKIIPNTNFTIKNSTVDLSENPDAWLAANEDTTGYVKVSIEGNSKIISKNILKDDISSIQNLLHEVNGHHEENSIVCAETVAVIGPEKTAYGNIPIEYIDEEKYPFVIFCDGIDPVGHQYWSGDSTSKDWAFGYLISDTYKHKANVTLLLRRDYTKDANDGTFYNFAFFRMHNLTFDLNGYTFDPGSLNFINAIIKSDTLAQKIFNFTIKNGTVKTTKTVVSINANANTTFDYGTNIRFENVNFDFGGKSVSLATTGAGVANNVTETTSAKTGVYPFYITFDADCDVINGSGTWNLRNNRNNYFNATVTCEHKEGQTACDFCAFQTNVFINGYSVDLGDKLGINFYVKDLSLVDTIKITIGGKTSLIKASDVAFDENENAYKIHAEVSSIQTRENVVMVFLNKNGGALKISTATIKNAYDYTTSVYEYVTTFTARATAAQVNYKNIAQALIDYAAFAENYFTTKAGGTFDMATAFPTAQLDVVTGTDAALIKGTVIGTSEKLADANLVLNDATKIRINLTAAAKVEGGENIVYTEANGKYYVDICGIDAKNLDTVYTFTVDGSEVKVSTLGVAAVVAGNETFYGAEFANLMKALYLYSTACEALV